MLVWVVLIMQLVVLILGSIHDGHDYSKFANKYDNNGQLTAVSITSSSYKDEKGKSSEIYYK